MIDLRRLRILQVLAERGTVTATAAALHLTPSAVSQQLHTLSRDVGAELLRKEGRLVQLTPAARILLEHTESLAAQWEQALARLAASDDEITGELRFCGLSSVVAALFMPAATQLRQQWPRLAVHIAEHESADCADLLLAGHADIAVMLPTPDTPTADDPRFLQRPLLDDPQDLLVPAGHRLADQQDVDLVTAADEPWIVKPFDNDTHTLLLAACTAAGFSPRITHHAKEWFAVSALVAAGFGVCLLPRMAPIPPQHNVVRVPLRGRSVPSRRFVSCVRRGSNEHPTVRAGLEALHSATGGAPAA